MGTLQYILWGALRWVAPDVRVAFSCSDTAELLCESSVIHQGKMFLRDQLWYSEAGRPPVRATKIETLGLLCTNKHLQIKAKQRKRHLGSSETCDYDYVTMWVITQLTLNSRKVHLPKLVVSWYCTTLQEGWLCHDTASNALLWLDLAKPAWLYLHCKINRFV